MLLFMQSFLLFSALYQEDNIRNASLNFSANAFAKVENHKHLEKVNITWRKLLPFNLSKDSESVVSKVNYVSAFCSLSINGQVKNCRISDSTVGAGEAHAVYIRVLEKIEAADCGAVLCSNVKVAIRMVLSVPAATAKPTNYCVVPFCFPESPPPYAPLKPLSGKN